MKSTIVFKNTTPELILAFLFSASIISNRMLAWKSHNLETKFLNTESDIQNCSRHFWNIWKLGLRFHMNRKKSPEISSFTFLR